MKNRINRNNYELYFIDYLDGKLSDSDIVMLEDFILLNPDLRTELEGTEKVFLSPGNFDFAGKELLKKPDLSLPIDESNFEDFCIAASEADLDPALEKAFKEYLWEHPEAHEIKNLYLLLRLKPDKSIVFPEKGKLKKAVFLTPQSPLIPLLYIAASIALMLLVYFRNIDIKDATTGITSSLSETVLPDTNTSVTNTANPDTVSFIPEPPVAKPEIQEAALLTFGSGKEKKQSPSSKKNETDEKPAEDHKTRDILPPQRLNPSIQIKLPYVAENNPYVPEITGSKITLSKVTPRQAEPEFLTVSEYARKQVAEKILGVKEIQNNRLSAWQIADASVTGLSKITGVEMKLAKTTANDGTVTAYSFDSKLLSFSTTASKD